MCIWECAFCFIQVKFFYQHLLLVSLCFSSTLLFLCNLLPSDSIYYRKQGMKIFLSLNFICLPSIMLLFAFCILGLFVKHTYTFIIIVFSWNIDPLITIMHQALALVIFFLAKYILYDIFRAILALLAFYSESPSTFYVHTICVFKFKRRVFLWHIVGSPFKIHFANLPFYLSA